MSSQDTLRHYEEQVLDAQYSKWPIWSYDKEQIIYALFAAFDSMYVVFRMVNPTTVGHFQHFKYVEEGFVYALRCFTRHHGISPLRPTGESPIICAAGDFLNFCARYALVAHLHQMTSQGLCDAEIDETTKMVTFVPRWKWEEGEGFSQGLQVDLANIKGTRSNVEPSAVREELENVNFSLFAGRIVFNDYNFLGSTALRGVATATSSGENLFLPANFKIRTFCFRQFISVMEIIQTWSFVSIMLYESLMNQGYPQESCMPTQVLKLDMFISVLNKHTRIEESVVLDIVSMLSYDMGHKGDVYLKPFYVSDGKIMWSPFQVSKSRYKRNLLKLMSRTPELEAEASNLIGSRETLLASTIGKLFAKKGGYSFKTNVPIKSPTGNGEIDILLYTNKAPSEVLLVEIKSVLAADDINEVKSATDQMMKGQKQIKKAIDILKTMPDRDKLVIYPFVNWDVVKEYYGLVVSPDTFPGRKYCHDDIPGTTFQIMKYQLCAKDFKKPSSICSAFKTMEWKVKPLSSNVVYEDIAFEDVTYRIPSVELDNPTVN